jgi:hypothetical protein
MNVGPLGPARRIIPEDRASASRFLAADEADPPVVTDGWVTVLRQRRPSVRCSDWAPAVAIETHAKVTAERRRMALLVDFNHDRGSRSSAGPKGPARTNPAHPVSPDARALGRCCMLDFSWRHLGPCASPSAEDAHRGCTAGQSWTETLRAPLISLLSSSPLPSSMFGRGWWRSRRSAASSSRFVPGRHL